MNNIKKLFKFMFGNSDHLMIKIGISSLVIGLIFSVFTVVSYKQSGAESNLLYQYFTYASGISFGIWLVTFTDQEGLTNIITNFIRILIFILASLWSLCFFINLAFNTNGNIPKNSIPYLILFSLILFASIIYFVTIFESIINLMKRIFVKFRIVLFNNAQPTSGFRRLAENLTVFLVTIGGLTGAFVAIAKSLKEILSIFFPGA